MVHSGIAASGRRRSMLAGGASLALHGGLLLVVVALTGTGTARYVVQPQQQAASTPVEIGTWAPQPASPQPASPHPAAPAPAAPAPAAPAPAAPAPAAPAPAHAQPAARPTSASAGAHARREPVQRSQPSAPAAVQSLADLKISYKDPTSFADRRAATKVDAASGAGRSGIGAGVDYRPADGVASMAIPQPATVSFARPPRPKHDYRNLRIVGASRFSGEIIKVQLTIDTHGKVRAVELLQGVDRDLDRKTIALVHSFEYEPALDDAGAAIPGTSRWDVQIVDDEDSDLFETAREHRRH
jgi:hypothetical protein